MLINNLELFIEVGGNRIPEYGQGGKTYVEGRKGLNYRFKIRNSSPSRVLIVPTVDGLSVMDGLPAHAGSSGYVVVGYSSLTVAGWRTSLNEIHQFEFSDRSGSYAGKSQSAVNCGVIGAMVFADKHQPVYYLGSSFTTQPMYREGLCVPKTPIDQPMYSTCSNALPHATSLSGLAVAMQAMQASAAQAPDFNLGTAWGSAAEDRVTTTTFDRGAMLAALEIYYTDAAGLSKIGIDVNKIPQAVFPQAFGGFCKPPV